MDRLEWLRALADSDAPACAWKVAAVLAWHVNAETGKAWPGLRKAVGVDATKRGLRWLTVAGWIALAEARPGRTGIYRLTRGNAAPGAGQHPAQDSTHTRGSAAPPPGAGLPPEQGIEQGNEQGSAEIALRSSLPAPTTDPEPGLADHERIGPVFPTKEGPGWRLDRGLMATLAKAHPGVDLLAELDKAVAWLACNPKKVKTARGMPRFIGAWLSNAAPTERPTPFPILHPGGLDDEIRYTPKARRKVSQ